MYGVCFTCLGRLHSYSSIEQGEIKSFLSYQPPAPFWLSSATFSCCSMLPLLLSFTAIFMLTTHAQDKMRERDEREREDRPERRGEEQGTWRSGPFLCSGLSILFYSLFLMLEFCLLGTIIGNVLSDLGRFGIRVRPWFIVVFWWEKWEVFLWEFNPSGMPFCCCPVPIHFPSIITALCLVYFLVL